MATQFNTVLPSQTQRDGMNLAYARSIGGILKLITIVCFEHTRIYHGTAPRGHHLLCGHPRIWRFGHMDVRFGAHDNDSRRRTHRRQLARTAPARRHAHTHSRDDFGRNWFSYFFRKQTPLQELSFYLWMSILWFVAIWLTVADAAGQSKEKQGVAIFCIVS
jgi:hypothetical protein